MKVKVILLALILATFGCRDIRDAELGEPFSKVEGLTATQWEIVEVEIVDGADLAQTSRDFSQFFVDFPNKLTIDFEEDGTFVVLPGDGPNVFSSDNGVWEFDDVNVPTQIKLNPDADVQILELEAPTRIVDQELKVKFDKYFCVLEEGEPEKPVYSYRLVFQRLNDE